jgi:hypothetical protein
MGLVGEDARLIFLNFRLIAQDVLLVRLNVPLIFQNQALIWIYASGEITNGIDEKAETSGRIFGVSRLGGCELFRNWTHRVQLPISLKIYNVIQAMSLLPAHWWRATLGISIGTLPINVVFGTVGITQFDSEMIPGVEIKPNRSFHPSSVMLNFQTVIYTVGDFGDCFLPPRNWLSKLQILLERNRVGQRRFLPPDHGTP